MLRSATYIDYTVFASLITFIKQVEKYFRLCSVSSPYKVVHLFVKNVILKPLEKNIQNTPVIFWNIINEFLCLYTHSRWHKSLGELGRKKIFAFEGNFK